MSVSKCMLNPSLPWNLHITSIKPLFLRCSKVSLFKVRFVLRCFQHLSLRAWLLGIPCQITDRLEAPKASSSRTIASFLSDTKTYPVDIKQTVSQRSEPSSRSLLMGEHPHPWALLHAQDRRSGHRCSKPRRR